MYLITFENIIKLGLFILFLLCAVYTHFWLPEVKIRIFYSTVKQHEKFVTSSKIKDLISDLISKNEKFFEVRPISELQKLSDWSPKYIKQFESNAKDNRTQVGRASATGHWRENVLSALGLLVLSERNCSDGEYMQCIEYTSDLIKVEAHVQDLLSGILPGYVYNVYDVYNTSQLFSANNYAQLIRVMSDGTRKIRDVFLGLQYLKLSKSYEIASDYPRARRNFELAIEWLGWDFLVDHMGSNRSILSRLYPRPHWPFVENLSFFTDFDINLLYGIMRVESAYDASKISSAGACGLMQIMPETAKSLSTSLSELERSSFNLVKKGKKSDLNCETLEDPLLNIRLSTIFLNQLQRKYEMFNVIAASYNAGETVVKKWMKKLSKTRGNLYHHVRYAETKRYIQKVLLAWVQYRSVYDGEGFTAQNVRYVN